MCAFKSGNHMYVVCIYTDTHVYVYKQTAGINHSQSLLESLSQKFLEGEEEEETWDVVFQE